MNFGSRLKKARKDAEMSGTELGDKMTPVVRKQTISHWENNTHRPDFDQLAQLCALLDTTPNALISGDMKRHTTEAQQIAAWIDDLSKADRTRWLEFLRMALRPPVDQEKVIEATPPRPITSFDKLR